MDCLFRWCSALVNTTRMCHMWSGSWVTMGDHGWPLPPSSTMTCSPGSTLCSTTCMCSHHASHWRCRIVHESLQRMGAHFWSTFRVVKKSETPRIKVFPSSNNLMWLNPINLARPLNGDFTDGLFLGFTTLCNHHLTTVVFHVFPMESPRSPLSPSPGKVGDGVWLPRSMLASASGSSPWSWLRSAPRFHSGVHGSKLFIYLFIYIYIYVYCMYIIQIHTYVLYTHILLYMCIIHILEYQIL